MKQKIAIVGAGLIGRRHIQTILAMPGAAELVAVADPVVDPAGFDIGAAAWFADAQALLDRVKPEAVIIATPNALHLQQGQWCCERGIHFLMEKPVTVTLDEAAALDGPEGVDPRVDRADQHVGVGVDGARAVVVGAIGARFDGEFGGGAVDVGRQDLDAGA